MIVTKLIDRVINKVRKIFSAQKKIDLIMAFIFISIIWIRLCIYMVMSFNSNDMGNIAKVAVCVFCIIIMIISAIIFGYGTLRESQGEVRGCSRADYLRVMKYFSGMVTGLLIFISPIYWANMSQLYILGFTSIPCIVVMVILYIIYKIKYEEETYNE